MSTEQPRTEPRPSTEDLIARLADEARPVRRIWSPSIRLAIWLGILGAILVAAVSMIGPRPDLAVKLGQISFAGNIVVLLTVAVASAALALRAAVPGREPPIAASAGVIVLVLGVLAADYANHVPSPVDGAPFVAMGWSCALATIVVAAVPLLVLLGAVRRGATFAPGFAGLLAGAAAFFAAAAALRLVCPLDERWHLLVWHLGPVALGLAASLGLGALWLSRWRRTS